MAGGEIGRGSAQTLANKNSRFLISNTNLALSQEKSTNQDRIFPGPILSAGSRGVSFRVKAQTSVSPPSPCLFRFSPGPRRSSRSPAVPARPASRPSAPSFPWRPAPRTRPRAHGAFAMTQQCFSKRTSARIMPFLLTCSFPASTCSSKSELASPQWVG